MHRTLFSGGCGLMNGKNQSALKARVMRPGMLAIFIAFALTLPEPGSAGLTRSEARQAVEHAQALTREKGWTEGVRYLQQRLEECGSGVSGRDCRPLINYTLGYLLEQEARDRPESRSELLTDAIGYYRQVLADVPNHGPTLNNLALIHRETGASEEAIRLLETAVKYDFSRRDRYAITIGDIHFDSQQWEAALHDYELAADWNPRAEEPALRIVEVYKHLPVERLQELSSLLESWKGAFPDAAERGYWLILSASVANNKIELAENALLSWVSLLSRNRRLTPGRIDELYLEWKGPATQELQGLVSPAWESSSFNWWRTGFLRRHVLAEAALFLGHTDLKKRGPKATEARWRYALNRIAPEMDEYFGKEYPLVPLELQTELAALYYQYPQLDPDNKKFAPLIWNIFRSKAYAYEKNDLKAIQSHHTVLGLIYARAPGREDESHRANNAVFQLHHAIKKAKERFDNGEAYQPLPQLKEMLADACRNPTPARQRSIRLCERGGRNAPGELYLETAGAYLDTDDLKQASRLLSGAQQAGLTPTGDKIHHALLQILQTRKRVATATAANFHDVGRILLGAQDGARWITEDHFGGLSRAFLKRQRFKTLFDFTVKAQGFSKTHESTAVLEEIKLLLASASKSLVLAGTGDQLRVEKLSALGIRYTSAYDCPDQSDKEDLRWVQRSLNKILKTKLTAYSRYGRDTREAILQFQRQYGLQVDGKAGPETKGKIRELLCQ